MAQYMPRTAAEQLLDAARSTEAWLDREFTSPDLPPPVKAMTQSLHRYARRSARLALAGPISPTEAERRISRMAKGSYALIAAQGL